MVKTIISTLAIILMGTLVPPTSASNPGIRLLLLEEGCNDVDGDRYGDPGSVECTYAQPDCDDADPNVNPGMTEIPGNSKDDDCNPATPAYPEPANTMALSYGKVTLIGSGVANQVILLLIPIGAFIMLRRFRRRGMGSRQSSLCNDGSVSSTAKK